MLRGRVWETPLPLPGDKNPVTQRHRRDFTNALRSFPPIHAVDIQRTLSYVCLWGFRTLNGCSPRREVDAMKFIVLAVLFLYGCAAFELPEATYSLPEVTYQSPLPQWPFHTETVSFNLTFKIHIAADGTVNDAIIESPTGSKEWDSLALEQVRKWRYSPALMNGRPTALWLRQTIRVNFDKPVLMAIADLTCPDRETADSLYALLKKGAPFDSLARLYSISDSRSRGGVVGEMDIHTLPVHISREIAVLHPGEISKPLKLGRTFVIYKRLGNGA